MQRNLYANLNLAGTNRIEELFNLSLTIPSKLEVTSLVQPGDFVEREFEFTTGILANVSNSFILQIGCNGTNPMICLFIKLTPKPREQVGFVNNTMSLSFVDLNDPTNALLGPIASSDRNDLFWFASRSGYNGFEFVPKPWPEQACVMNFSTRLFYRKLPEWKDDGAIEMKDDKLLGKLDSNDFFKSETFSDVLVECQGEKFPAHRIILAGRSPVFKAMLTHATREADEGQIVIQDVDAPVFEGLLRFIYTGQVEQELLEERGEELYRAADKYDVKDLLQVCEAQLLNQVKIENALVMYDLAQSRPKSLLAKKSSEIISSNKEGIAADVDSFKNFTIKYPMLMFEIFKR